MYFSMDTCFTLCVLDIIILDECMFGSMYVLICIYFLFA